MTKTIRDWDALRRIPKESATHTLEVNDCNAWLMAKDKHTYDDTKPFMEQVTHLDVYLSTHTFYGEKYNWSTEVLQKCGFDVQLVNWDKR